MDAVNDFYLPFSFKLNKTVEINQKVCSHITLITKHIITALSYTDKSDVMEAGENARSRSRNTYAIGYFLVPTLLHVKDLGCVRYYYYFWVALLIFPLMEFLFPFLENSKCTRNKQF